MVTYIYMVTYYIILYYTIYITDDRLDSKVDAAVDAKQFIGAGAALAFDLEALGATNSRIKPRKHLPQSRFLEKDEQLVVV